MKNGFTLIEVLAVIAILAIISVIFIPSIYDIITKGKENLYQAQLDEIKLAAEKWAYKNIGILPSVENEQASITLLTLKESGEVPLNVKDPRTGNLIPNDMIITITLKNNNYIIEVDGESGTDITDEVNKDSPIIVLNGNHIQFVEINSVYDEYGARAKDKNNNVLDDIKIIYMENDDEIYNIDTSRFATYLAIYSITDNGNTSQIARTIIIRDTTPPNLVIPGNIDLTSSQLSNFDVMAGVSATDNSGDIVSVTVSGFDSSLTDKIVEYQACDSRNNCVTKRRLINIVE